jgi:phage/conjugal plasmid C-4 type zinc finger TraR family protein
VNQFELAQELDARFLRHHIDKQLRKGRTDVGHGTTACIDCGESIPTGRREAEPGCIRCIFCQESHEKGGA